jgi:hypothetical protein
MPEIETGLDKRLGSVKMREIRRANMTSKRRTSWVRGHQTQRPRKWIRQFSNTGSFGRSSLKPLVISMQVVWNRKVQGNGEKVE